MISRIRDLQYPNQQPLWEFYGLDGDGAPPFEATPELVVHAPQQPEQEAEQVWTDPWAMRIGNALEGHSGRIRTEELLKLLKLDDFAFDLKSGDAQVRFGDVMRSLGWLHKQFRFRGFTNPQWGYCRGDEGNVLEVDAAGKVFVASRVRHYYYFGGC